MKSTIPLKTYVEAYLANLGPHVNAARDVDALAKVFETIKPLRSFVADASINALERRKALEMALPKAQSATLNLAVILSDHGRMKDLSRLPGAVREALAKREGKKNATVTSALPLKGEDARRIEKALAKVAGCYVKLETRTDPSLIAGLKVQIGDWVYDASLCGRLDRLQHALTL